MRARLEISSTDFGRMIGKVLVDDVKRIDQACYSFHNGVENGLCNVKRQFRDAIASVTGKKLTEETIISWLLGTRLQKLGYAVGLEQKFPDSDEECDLVIGNPGQPWAWIEVKLAWKNWMNCDGTIGSNSVYKAYLFGDKSHNGAAHDFAKLEHLTHIHARLTGVLLIGFDVKSTPITLEILDLERREKLIERGWRMEESRTWPDRRNDVCRIGCWFWNRPILQGSL